MANLSYIQQISEIANSHYPYAVATETLEEMQFKSLLQRSGYEILSDGSAIYNQSVASGINNISGNLAIQTELVEDATTHELSIIADNFIEKSATSTAPKITKGALSFNVTPFVMVGGALAGANLGWQWYQDYPEFWTDLSNDVFFNSDKDLLPGIKENELVRGGQLILRVLENGGVRGYCEKKRLEQILKTAYDKGVFNANGEFVPQYTESGTYKLMGGGATPQIINSVVQCTDSNIDDAITNIINALNQYYHKNINAVSMFKQLIQGGTIAETFVTCYELVGDDIPIVVTDDSVTADMSRYFCGYIQFRVLLSDGRLSLSTWHTDRQPYNNYIGGFYYEKEIYSTVGSEYKPPKYKNELIYNENLPTVTDRNDVFANFPTWLENGFSIPRYNEETKENEQIDFLPFPIFDFSSMGAKQPNPNDKNGDLPQNPTDPLKLPQFLIDFLGPSIPLGNDTPSENPNGSTPVLIPPSNNNSSKLFTVYNPSNINLDSLGSYLWSDSIATLIKELFSNNRMDAIISLHQVYCTPSTTTAHNIILGNLDSGVSAPVVNNQYVEIDCGSVYIAEKYGDARDYLNVDCQVYLPFIGFRNIDPHDVINCYLHVKYTIDVYTGSCLGQLIVTKGNITQTLYTFEGNCSVQIPLTGSDRARIIGAIASTVATGITTGGVGLASMAVGQVASGGAQSSIQRTSGFSGNCGAMAIKKPYVVMTRLKSADAVDYNKIVGNPTNKTVYLRNCNGFTRVKEIHLDSLKCTDEEKRLIYNVLKQGIVL